MNPRIKQEILSQLSNLSPEQRRQVMDFIRTLSKNGPAGTPGRDLLRFAGAIGHSDLEIMAKAIEQGCEKVDLSEW